MHAYSNAGLLNTMGWYDDTPADMALENKLFFKNGWLHMVGGCRGSTPPEIYYIQTYIYQSKRTIFPRFLCVTSQHSMEHDALWISTSLSRLKVTTAGAYALFVFTRWSRTTEKRNQVDEDGKVPWRSFSWSGLAL